MPLGFDTLELLRALQDEVVIGFKLLQRAEAEFERGVCVRHRQLRGIIELIKELLKAEEVEP